jgi:hypothetical protein
MLLMFTLAIGIGAKRQLTERETLTTSMWQPAYAVVSVTLIATVAWLSMERGVWALATGHRYEYVANKLRQAKDLDRAAEVYALASRHVRYQGHTRWRRLQALVLDKQYDAALALFDDSSREGLSPDALYWKALALKGKDRNAEALVILKDLKEFASPESKLYRQVQRQIKRIEAPVPVGKEGVSAAHR